MMQDVYEKCPVLEDDTYRIRLMEKGDATDLLSVYSDEKAVRYFNSDNCHGDDFYYTTINRMQKAVEFWLLEYERRGFVRFTIVDKSSEKAVGTIEVFHRESNDYFNHCGLLRLDVGSELENKQELQKMLKLITKPAFELFSCNLIVTKAETFATERIEALKSLGYRKSSEKLIGDDGTCYTQYWVC